MVCPHCRFANQEGAKYCLSCGEKLELRCPRCEKPLPAVARFCDQCGVPVEREVSGVEGAQPPPGERKPATVLFSDLSGYTALSEKIDPEEVRELMNDVFREIAEVVTKYEGSILKFLGDAVMAVFGLPRAHEDAPVRAIRAALEIHHLVKTKGIPFEGTIDHSLAMHSGINTGLVVTSMKSDPDRLHDVTGDPINLAARLMNRSARDEILVGANTFQQSEGFFDFQKLEPIRVKGKSDPVPLYKVLSIKESPEAMHRTSGLRADLVGRQVEMDRLTALVRRLEEGKGAIGCLRGEAGTGKSRLVREFMKTLDPAAVRWVEGRSYAYSQNIPYFLLTDLLRRTWHIEEGDARETVKEKIESNITALLGERSDVLHSIGSLFDLGQDRSEDFDPESWQLSLRTALKEVLSALASEKPTVICLEDLHWSDPSSVELMRFLLLEFRRPVLFLCVYRPTFSLFTGKQRSALGPQCQEIILRELSPPEVREMLRSLLNSERIPPELLDFTSESTGGNPFYLEEVVNSFIDSKALGMRDGNWTFSEKLSGSEIPLTISGVISDRLDHLGPDTKRILQEASVIGRVFPYDILMQVTELKGKLDDSLRYLEKLDLIREKAIRPDIEYVFKHALTHDVVYDGLLKKDRRKIHEKIGYVMERLRRDRISEFYETLAFHFKRSRAFDKAVDYLTKSGEKSTKRYSLQEAHEYYRTAFDLLSGKAGKTREDDKALLDMLLKWMLVFYYQGSFREMSDLLTAHRELAESLDDRELLGLFSMWTGMTHMQREQFQPAFDHLRRALAHGEETENLEVVAHACTWLCYTCADLGMPDEGLRYGKRALEFVKAEETGHFLYHLAMGGMGFAYWVKGDRENVLETGRRLLEYGRKYTNVRSLVFGHWLCGYSHMVDGDYPSSIESNLRAIEISADPWYSQFPRLNLGFSYALNGQFAEAKEPLENVLAFCESYGGEILGTPAKALMGAIIAAEGAMSRGLRMLEEVRDLWRESHCRWRYLNSEFVLGSLYLRMATAAAPLSLPLLVRNAPFLMKNLPLADGKAQRHFRRVIRGAEEIGARGLMGHACYELGKLHAARKREGRAREYLEQAIRHLEECRAETILARARELLGTLAAPGAGKTGSPGAPAETPAP